MARFDSFAASVDIAARLMTPLIVGGKLRPIRPLGERRAVQMAHCAADRSGRLDAAVEKARLRAARTLCPVDSLPPMDYGQWLLAAAFNDLLQATNPTLVGMFGERRARRLLTTSDAVIARAGAPRTVMAALSRHVSYARAIELKRSDTTVSWWVGTRTFRGMSPPGRLTAWPRLRRVRCEQTAVGFASLAIDETWESTYLHVAARWIAASPLTDVANIDRRRPPFRPTGALLALLKVDFGRTLAVRVVDRAGLADRAPDLLRRAVEDARPRVPREAQVELIRLADEIEVQERALHTTA